MSESDPVSPSSEASSSPKIATPASSSRKRLILAVLLCVALVLLGIWLVRWWTHGRFIESTNDAYLQADQVTVSTRVAGFVDQVLVGDNQTVKAGQVLVRLDEREPRARFEQA